MAVKLADIEAFVIALPGVVVGERFHHRTWMVNERGFVWERKFSKADIKRYGDQTPPNGDIVAVTTADLDDKDVLLAMKLPGFFTIPHFNGYPAVLIQLNAARIRDVRGVIRDAWRRASAAPPRKPRKRASRQF